MDGPISGGAASVGEPLTKPWADQSPTATLDEAPATPSVLAVRGVWKSYGGVHAVQDVTLAFPAGTVTAIVGDNGAGKTTLIKILSGVVQPDRGTVEVDGQDTRLASPAVARGLGIETVHQDLALADHRDVAENLFMGRELTHRIGPVGFLAIERMRAQTKRALADLNVNVPSIRRQVRRLSGGQRQAIAIGRAVHWGSRLLIMDEPLAALGLHESARVQELIESLAKRGLTQVVVSHNLDHVFRLATRIAVMRLGHLVGIRSAAATNHEEILRLVAGLSPGEPAVGGPLT